MRQYSIMLKPASSACNLRCKYCFYADLASKRDTVCFGSMQEDTARNILQNLCRDLEPGDQVTFAFQGGEPTLVGLPWYRHFVSLVEQWDGKFGVSYALQTNGMLLDDAWGQFLGENNFLVGLSVDGMPSSHNSCRVDPAGKGTYKQVMNAVALLRKHKVEFNVLCTLTSEIARHPSQIWNWICQNDFKYVQFTPCLDALDAPGENAYALHPKRFSSFYSQLFPLWLADFQRGKYRSIKLFDDIVNLLAYGIPTACGIHGKCQCQMVVEADGSAYPCDFYCLDPYRLGNLQTDSLLQMMNSQTATEFLSRPREKMQYCSGCPYEKFCGGGCRRMCREVFYGPSDAGCGYREFLDQAMPDLQRIAMGQRQYRYGRG